MTLYTGIEISPKWRKCPDLVHIPFIAIEPLDWEMQYPEESYTHFLATSRQAVKILRQKLHTPKHWLAVGKRTADAIAFHFPNTVIQTTQLEQQEGMPPLLASLKNPRLLWGHSEAARPIIQNYCAERGLQLDAPILYRPIPLFPTPLPDLTQFHTIIFTSPSTVQAFFKCYDQLPKKLTLKALGPVTKKAITDLTGNQQSVMMEQN